MKHLSKIILVSLLLSWLMPLSTTKAATPFVSNITTYTSNKTYIVIKWRVAEYIDETTGDISDKRKLDLAERDEIEKKANIAATEELREEGQTGLVEPRGFSAAMEYNDKKQYVFEKHMAIAPDVRFDHPALYERSGKYTPADKIAALVAYKVTGNARKASLYCGVPAATISSWRKKAEWWEPLSVVVAKEKNDEIEAMMTGFLHQSLEEIETRMHEGDTFYDNKRGTTYKLPVKLKDLTTSVSMIFDKRQLARGAATSISGKMDTNTRLAKLGKEFEKFSKAKTIEGEVEVTEE